MQASVDLGGRRIIKKIFFKQKTAYEIGGSDWSSDVCSSDLVYEYVVAAVVVGDESVAFLRIEPLNCTVVHFGTSINKIFRTALNKSPYISVGLYSRKLTCICNSFNVQMTYKIACEFNNASELL